MPTYPLTFPSSLSPSEATWEPVSRVSLSSSPLTGAQKLYAHPAQWWEAALEFPPISPSESPTLLAFFLSLNGLEGTFTLPPSDPTPQASISGTCTVDSVSGYELTISGQTGSFTAGDWIQIESGLYRVTSGGAATIEVWPKPRSGITASTSTIEYNSPVGTFRLSSRFSWEVDRARIHGFAISIKEVL